jgi:hypothetical protein
MVDFLGRSATRNDGDALPYSADPSSLEAQSGGRLRLLPLYHVENYFLDERILAAIFAKMESGSWLSDPMKVGKRLKEIAYIHASYACAHSHLGDQGKGRQHRHNAQECERPNDGGTRESFQRDWEDGAESGRSEHRGTAARGNGTPNLSEGTRDFGCAKR